MSPTDRTQRTTSGPETSEIGADAPTCSVAIHLDAEQTADRPGTQHKIPSLSTNTAAVNAPLPHLEVKSAPSSPASPNAGRWEKIRQLIRLMRRVIELIRRRGGPGALFREVLSVMRDEGYAGLKLRLDLWRADSSKLGALDDKAYQKWIELFDTIGEGHRSLAKSTLARWPRRPLISIVVPTYEAPEIYLREMIESVRAQLYPHWELCIADDASSDRAVGRIVAEYAKQDPRIKFFQREINGHISEASNSALELANGEYIALLDQDDMLPEHALYVVAKYINSHPHGRLFYSDEDKLIAGGVRSTPYFKPDWNPELILTQNLFSHLGVFERQLMREVGGFRKGFEGSQDLDLVLRCVMAAGDHAVVHIPHVLYHWRVIPGSTSAGIGQKPYVLRASIAAVEAFLLDSGTPAIVTQALPGSNMLRVAYELPKPTPSVSIIIVAQGDPQALKSGIDSILSNTDYRNFEVLIVVNESLGPDTLQVLHNFTVQSNLRVIHSIGALSVAALSNSAAQQARSEYICLIHAGTRIATPNWLDEMMGHAARPQNGVVGGALWYADDTLCQGPLLLGIGNLAATMHYKTPRGYRGYFGRAALTQNVSVISSACLLIRKSLYIQAHGLDEALEDTAAEIDLSLKVEEFGYRNVYTPYAQFYTDNLRPGAQDSTAPSTLTLSDAATLRLRWGNRATHDRFYNPNLALEENSLFSLAFPPRTTPFD